jgi:hypothetical protein
MFDSTTAAGKRHETGVVIYSLVQIANALINGLDAPITSASVLTL